MSLHNTFGQSVIRTIKLKEKQKPDLCLDMPFSQNCAHYNHLIICKKSKNLYEPNVRHIWNISVRNSETKLFPDMHFLAIQCYH